MMNARPLCPTRGNAQHCQQSRGGFCLLSRYALKFFHWIKVASQITRTALHLSYYLSIPLHLAAFISTKTFADLVESLGPHGAFFLYGCVCIFGAIFTCIFLPETKGRSQNQPDPVQLKEMQQYSTVPNQA